MIKLDLEREMAWVSFIDEAGFEKVWYPVTDARGNQLEWDSTRVMNFCRAQFNVEGAWVRFGIAPTSQMIMQNSVRDNL